MNGWLRVLDGNTVSALTAVSSLEFRVSGSGELKTRNFKPGTFLARAFGPLTGRCFVFATAFAKLSSVSNKKWITRSYR